MTTNRDKIMGKIRALLSKTIENGCTEAEAMAALSMAQAMMDAYEVTEADLNEVKQESAIKETMKDMRDPHHIRRQLCVGIAEFTHTKAYTNQYKPQKFKYNFIGTKSDVDFAMWLTETLTMFVQKELKNYIWSNKYTSLPPSEKRVIINGFVLGCCSRIVERLRELVNQSETNSSYNANALVVIKNDLVIKKMNELGLRLRDPRNRGTRINSNSYSAGKSAGDKAQFGRPVHGQNATLRIR